MSFPRRQKISEPFLSLILCLGVFACGPDSKSGEHDSAAVVASAIPVSPPSPVNTGWDEKAAGSFMILSADDDGVSAALVLPNETDSSLAKTDVFHVDPYANAGVDLFSSAGSAGKSSVAINSQQPPAEGCLVWPSIRLMTKPSVQWSVGFPTGHAKPIQIDSVEALGSADSTNITTELARRASAISVNADPAFQGLPFIVQKAYRLSMGDTTVLVGSIIRKINEEANPREEHLLLVLERHGAGAPFSVGYQNRIAGAEESVRTTSLLAAVRFASTNRAVLVIAFAYDDGGQVALLERSANYSWKITWKSAYTGC